MTNIEKKSLIVAIFITSALFAYNATAPLLTAFFPSGAAFSIGIIRSFTVISALLMLVFMSSRKIPTLLLWLTPYFIFRIAFLARMTENLIIQNLTFYLDMLTAYLVFFGFGLIPSVVAAKFATTFSQNHFAKCMNVLVIIFALGLLLNFSVLFNPDAVRVGLYRINAISLTSTAIAFIFYLLIYLRHSKFNLQLAIVLLPILIGAVVVSKSRGPLVGMFIAFFVYLTIASPQNRKQLLIGSVLLAVLIYVGSLFFKVDIIGLLLDRFFFSTNYSSDLDLSGASRLFLWNSAWNQFLEDPVIGRYISEQISNYYPHNIVLESLISMGVVGAALLAIFVGTTTYAAFSILRDDFAFKPALFFIIIFYKELAESMFSGNLIGNAELWITSCLIVAMHLAARMRSRKTQHSARTRAGNAAAGVT